MDSFETLLNELVKIKAREILFNEDCTLDTEEVKRITDVYTRQVSGLTFPVLKRNAAESWKNLGRMKPGDVYKRQVSDWKNSGI